MVAVHISAHLEQSSDLWKESSFYALKPFSDPNQCVVSGHNREINFKTSVLFTKMPVQTQQVSDEAAFKLLAGVHVLMISLLAMHHKPKSYAQQHFE